MQLTGEQTIERVKALALELQRLFGDQRAHINLTVSEIGIAVTAHVNHTYKEAIEWFRWLGIEDRQKTVYPTYTQLRGVKDGVDFTTYPDELPPCCRVVKKIRTIPKTEVMETGDTIEITEEVVECGPAKTEASVCQ